MITRLRTSYIWTNLWIIYYLIYDARDIIINQSTSAGSFSIVLLTAICAIAASLIITLIYYSGCKEFRNKSILMVLLGNTIITLTFIISGNPLAALLSHTAMHVAAVIRGPETTLQLPPHYGKQ